MKLQEQMDAFKMSFVEQVPEQALKIMEHSGEKLRDSGIANQAVKVGEKAPDFSLSNTMKSEVCLSDLLKNGPVVLSFFRGRW
jgi:hypothetical protein